MTAVLPWVTLAVCLAITLARVPSALRGENREVFYIFSLISLSILISIEAPYLVIDGWLGGMNIGNLILRFLLYGTFFFMGIKIATAFGSASAVRAIRGPVGITAAAIVGALTIYFFVITDTQGSSAGMSGLKWGPSLDGYAAMGRLYPGFVAACLVPAIWRTVVEHRPHTVAGGLGVPAVGTFLAPVVPTLSPHSIFGGLVAGTHQLFGCPVHMPRTRWNLVLQVFCAAKATSLGVRLSQNH